jgi:hypothetical protein
VLLDETPPGGVLGVLRILAFATVIAGAVLLARPDVRGANPSESPTDTG